MPQTALIRNLGKMTSIGLVAPGSAAARKVAAQLVDAARIKSARVHPVALLSALKVYEQGHGERARLRANALSWTPVREVVDALDEAFYRSFQGITPAGKAHLLALDVSGSMGSGAIAGVPGLTPRVATAAMALVTAKTEPSTIASRSARRGAGTAASGEAASRACSPSRSPRASGWTTCSRRWTACRSAARTARCR